MLTADTSYSMGTKWAGTSTAMKKANFANDTRGECFSEVLLETPDEATDAIVHCFGKLSNNMFYQSTLAMKEWTESCCGQPIAEKQWVKLPISRASKEDFASCSKFEEEVFLVATSEGHSVTNALMTTAGDVVPV